MVSFYVFIYIFFIFLLFQGKDLKTMAPVTCQGYRRDLGQILFSSLLILGLDATGLEHSLRTPVNEVATDNVS